MDVGLATNKTLEELSEEDPMLEPMEGGSRVEPWLRVRMKSGDRQTDAEPGEV